MLARGRLPVESPLTPCRWCELCREIGPCPGLLVNSHRDMLDAMRRAGWHGDGAHQCVNGFGHGLGQRAIHAWSSTPEPHRRSSAPGPRAIWCSRRSHTGQESAAAPGNHVPQGAMLRSSQPQPAPDAHRPRAQAGCWRRTHPPSARADASLGGTRRPVQAMRRRARPASGPFQGDGRRLDHARTPVWHRPPLEEDQAGHQRSIRVRAPRHRRHAAARQRGQQAGRERSHRLATSVQASAASSSASRATSCWSSWSTRA